MAAPIAAMEGTLESLNRLLEENHLVAPATNYDSKLAENVRHLLGKLTVFLRNPELRAILQPVNFENLRQTIGFFADFLDGGSPDVVGLVTESLRCLRNSCVQQPRNQNILKHLNIMSIIEKCLTTIQEAVGRRGMQLLAGRDQWLSALRCSVQFMGNYVTGNQTTQKEVWTLIFPEILKSLVTCSDDKTCDYSCMLLYNCLILEHQKELTESSQGVTIIQDILLFCEKDSDQDWGILVVEKLVETSDEFGEVYWQLPQSSKLTLLSLLCAHLSQERTEPEPEKADCDNEGQHQKEGRQLSLTLNLQYSLAKEFEDSAHSLLTFSTTNRKANSEIDSENQQSAWLVVKILETLCAVTSHHQHPEEKSLRDRTSLLETVIALLHATHRLGQSGCQAFAISQRLVMGAESTEPPPAHGFKRDLIRLIGNMSYHHPANQNKVRDLEGIPLVLDHCVVDENNPFIQQWAILTIRNLCEANSENQEVIAALEKQGREVTIEPGAPLMFKTTKKT